MAWFTPEGAKQQVLVRAGGEKLAKIGQTKLLGQVPITGVSPEMRGQPIVLRMYFATDAFMKVAEQTAEQVAVRKIKMKYDKHREDQHITLIQYVQIKTRTSGTHRRGF